MGPLQLYRMEMRPGAMLTIIWMMKKGDSRSNPFSRPLRCCSSSEEMPPMPEPTMTPTFSGAYPLALSAPMGMPDSLTAISAAARAYWAYRSIRRTSRLSMNCSGSKSFTSPAMRASIFPGSKRVTRAIPDLPASIACQFFSVPVPSAEMSPVPVTTTRRCDTVLSGGACWDTGDATLDAASPRTPARRGAAYFLWVLM